MKRFLVVQNFSKTLRIGFISFNLSSLDKGCLYQVFIKATQIKRNETDSQSLTKI